MFVLTLRNEVFANKQECFFYFGSHPLKSNFFTNCERMAPPAPALPRFAEPQKDLTITRVTPLPENAKFS